MGNMSDIARKCGVSRAVVSLVLNGRDRQLGIAAKTRAHVLAVTEELGYYRNEIAASIRHKHSRVLAFVSSNMGSVEYTSRIQNGVFDEASRHGYSVAVYHLAENNQDEILRCIISWRSAGVIFHVTSTESVEMMVHELQRNSIPCGFVNLSNPGGIGITTDDQKGIYDLIHLLSIRGACRPIFATYCQDSVSMEFISRRLAGFRAGLSDFFPGMHPIILSACGNSATNLPKLPDHFVSELSLQHYDAIICDSDSLALQIQQVLLQRGIGIPDEMMLCGFGGLYPTTLMIPSLTTAVQDFERMGNRVAELVFEAIDGKSCENMNEIIAVEIVENESTRRNLSVRKEEDSIR